MLDQKQEHKKSLLFVSVVLVLHNWDWAKEAELLLLPLSIIHSSCSTVYSNRHKFAYTFVEL